MESTALNMIAKRLQDRLDAAHPLRRGQQTWLAKAVGMKPQGIQSILAGAVDRPKRLKEMAEVLKTSQAYLLGETDDPSPEEPDMTDPVERLRSALLAYGVHPDDLSRIVKVIDGFVDDADDDERS